MPLDQSAAIDAIGIADTLFPIVSQSVSETAADDEYRRSLLLREKSITLASGQAALTEDVLTHYIGDSTLIDPSNLNKKYAWRAYPDFIRRGDKRLGVFSLQGRSLLVIEPNANFTVPLTASGARTLTVPCTVIKPATADDEIDAPDEIISDLDEALANALRGAIIKEAGAAA